MMSSRRNFVRNAVAASAAVVIAPTIVVTELGAAPLAPQAEAVIARAIIAANARWYWLAWQHAASGFALAR